MTQSHLTNSPAISIGDLYDIHKFAEAHSHLLNTTTLRWQLRHRDTNGLASAVVQIGRRLFISKSRYEAWLATQAGVPA